MSRPTFAKFKKKALENSKVKQQYQELELAYALRKKLVALRKAAGLTQEEIAEKLGTNKSNISRLESVHSSISPKLSTIHDYAAAIGHEVQIEFVPKTPKRRRRTTRPKR